MMAGTACKFRLARNGDSAAATLAHDDNTAALAGLVFGQAAVLAIIFVVGGLNMAAEISAINFHSAGKCNVLHFRSHALAQLVGHDVGGAILAIEVARKLQRANALRAIGEDRNSGENVPHFHFAAGENRAAGGAELRAAAFALEDAAALVAVDVHASALATDRLPAILGPPNGHEHSEGFSIREAHDIANTEGPGLGGEEEVLGHFYNDFDISIPNMI